MAEAEIPSLVVTSADADSDSSPAELVSRELATEDTASPSPPPPPQQQQPSDEFEDLGTPAPKFLTMEAFRASRYYEQIQALLLRGSDDDVSVRLCSRLDEVRHTVIMLLTVALLIAIMPLLITHQSIVWVSLCSITDYVCKELLEGCMLRWHRRCARYRVFPNYLTLHHYNWMVAFLDTTEERFYKYATPSMHPIYVKARRVVWDAKEAAASTPESNATPTEKSD
jgi:hypothetical protein